MRLFVYEYCTALGLGREVSDPAHSLFREGRAMRDAVAADMRAFAEPILLDGVTKTDEREQFQRAIASADFAIIIAPETDGILETRLKWALESGKPVLGPTPAAARLCGDKLALATHWQTHGVPTPQTWRLEGSPAYPFPAMIKPIDGAGSVATRLIRSQSEAAELIEAHPEIDFIVQEYVPGVAVSVAVLIGGNECVPLMPCFQHLSTEGHFCYLGGELPLPPELMERATSLARQAVACVPGLGGYIGVDLVLGDRADVAIEINPRLTTSYVGLRAACHNNLASTMVRLALGDVIAPLRWKPIRVQFRSDGEIQTQPNTST